MTAHRVVKYAQMLASHAAVPYADMSAIPTGMFNTDRPEKSATFSTSLHLAVHTARLTGKKKTDHLPLYFTYPNTHKPGDLLALDNALYCAENSASVKVFDTNIIKTYSKSRYHPPKKTIKITLLKGHSKALFTALITDIFIAYCITFCSADVMATFKANIYGQGSAKENAINCAQVKPFIYSQLSMNSKTVKSGQCNALPPPMKSARPDAVPKSGPATVFLQLRTTVPPATATAWWTA
ncbi:hypothetical protein [Nocardia jejuensis]|uniref:hypothetical protein n=1 Tax=Nocardia jejuensis TaxID=328049 RepID=UPI0012FC7EDD|nr:hypothetical protein [Nocardia jejuensis]